MNLRYLLNLATLLVLCILSGCQDEVLQITEPPNDLVITPNSNAAALIRRTTLKDGSSDNILDSASCLSVVLPVTVIVNGQEIQVTSEEDLKYVERILDEFESDDDEVTIIFPITVVLADHSQLIIINVDELENLKEQCTEGGNDDDIECVDFQYPLEMAIYDTDNQVSDIITISNDDELYNFFDELNDDDLVGFQFPIVMIFSNGQEIAIDNNEELEGAIENAKGDCDEDDDTDFEDDDIDDSIFITTLLNGPWQINYFFRETDQTAEFTNFSFTFNIDGTVQATDGVSVGQGTWASYGDDGGLELVLDLGEDSPFNQIHEDWEVIEFNEMSITLKDERNESSDPVKTLIFQKL